MLTLSVFTLKLLFLFAMAPTHISFWSSFKNLTLLEGSNLTHFKEKFEPFFLIQYILWIVLVSIREWDKASGYALDQQEYTSLHRNTVLPSAMQCIKKLLYIHGRLADGCKFTLLFWETFLNNAPQNITLAVWSTQNSLEDKKMFGYAT
jgi:hypothetical protein